MVVEAIPNGVFEQSAVQAVKEWRFNPGEYEGDSVSVRMTQTLRFQLRCLIWLMTLFAAFCLT